MNAILHAWLRHVLSASLLMCLFTVFAWAAQQAGTELVTLSGTVTDSSGAVLQDVTIQAIVDGRTETTTTGPDGRYSLRFIPGPRFELHARREGFAEEILALEGSSLSVTNITLRLAPVADTVVVTASRTPETLASITASIAVFTAEDIEALGSQSLSDVIRTVPGLNIESVGREGALTSLFSRGGESDYNLVLIDGVRMNRSGGSFDFSLIPASEIERVEVVRGAQSAAYGSDAIGAVVQVFTKRPEPTAPVGISGSVEGGSFETLRSNLRIGGGIRQRFDYSFGVNYRGSEGALAEILPEPDRFDQTVVDGSLGTMLGYDATIRAGIRYSNARGRIVGQTAYGSRDTGTRADTRDLTWHITFNQSLGARANHTATASYFGVRGSTVDLVSDPAYNIYAIMEGTPGALFPHSPRLVRLINAASFDRISAGHELLAPGRFLAMTSFPLSDFIFASNSRLRRPALKYQMNLDWAGANTLSAGYEFERETDPSSQGFLVQNHAYFLQQQFNFDERWFATLGGRVDDNNRFGTSTSPKASVGGLLVPFRTGAVSSVKAFVNAGRGIKNPIFTELYSTQFTDGNPNLNPELGRTVDAGLEVTLASQRWLGRVTYFDNKYTDQVAYRPTDFAPDGQPDYVNIEGSKANGWEVDLAMQRPIFGFTVRAAYAFVDTEVTATVSTSEQFQPGQPLLRRPKHSGNGWITYQRGRARLDFDARYVGTRHDNAFVTLTAFPDRRSLTITFNPAYTLLGFGGEFQVREDLTLYARVNNLRNTYYESALGYQGLPRSFTGGVRFTMR